MTQSNPANLESLPLQDLVVVGGGPAGVAAAIYAARKGLTLTVVAYRVGGQAKDARTINSIANLHNSSGPEFAADLHAQLQAFDITLREHVEVQRIEPGEIKKLHLSTGEQIQSKAVIIATGAKWRELGIPGERENIGQGVAYCPHCDGPYFKGRDVAVIGGGNTGFEAALNLTAIVRSVTVIEPTSDFTADRALLDRADSCDNITTLAHAQAHEILSENGKVSGLRYKSGRSNEMITLKLAGIFVQLGLLPNSDFMRGVVDINSDGEIIIDAHCRTSAPGILACGDITTTPYKQIVIAMGEGAKASLASYEYLMDYRLI